MLLAIMLAREVKVPKMASVVPSAPRGQKDRYLFCLLEFCGGGGGGWGVRWGEGACRDGWKVNGGRDDARTRSYSVKRKQEKAHIIIRT